MVLEMGKSTTMVPKPGKGIHGQRQEYKRAREHLRDRQECKRAREHLRDKTRRANTNAPMITNQHTPVILALTYP